MSLEFLVASAVGVLTAAGIYLCLRGRTLPVVLGLAMLSSAIKVFLFAMGRLVIDRPPIYEKGLPEYTDPLPQALVLRSEAHTSELTSLLSRTYDIFCLKKKHKEPLTTLASN